MLFQLNYRITDFYLQGQINFKTGNAVLSFIDAFMLAYLWFDLTKLFFSIHTNVSTATKVNTFGSHFFLLYVFRKEENSIQIKDINIPKFTGLWPCDLKWFLYCETAETVC